MLLSSPTTLTSLLAGCSTTSNLCKYPQARAGSEPATKGSKQTEPAPAEPAQALRVALLPHHTFSQAGKELNSFISDCLQLKTPHYQNFCNTLQTIILFISIMTVSCQML